MADNTLSVYDPIFYAQEALEALEKQLGMANRVFRGYDKNPQTPGSVISIRVPSVFSAKDAPSTAQAIQASEVQIILDRWKEVKFALTDKELTYTTDRIVNEHIRPAAYALADNIDQALAGLYVDIPWVTTVTDTPVVGDITAARKILANLGNPMGDGLLHMMVNPDLEAALLSLSAFSQQQGAGDAGVQTQLSGSLGRKFGFEVFMNQNVPSHTSGVAADAAGALTAQALAGATTLALDSITTAGTVKKGDTFSIAGDAQRYTVTADKTASGGAITDLAFAPGLKMQHEIGDVITFDLLATGTTKPGQNLAFHRGAFALAMAPLSEMGNGIGANIATVQDPVTGLTLRSRLFYLGDSSTVVVALDVLYGVKTLNPNRAVRMRF